ncbi:orotidine-5'-phosphate decarboxylase [Rubinisphaera margarita]|uniref:orotidine-5'-phosphate decarboxylase n=1 Tax=Rubinisphaera margarita TaxID=2909586 RepID=UPI001EE855C8|nr:orotidine-5'-phosphate decarboxylase [Rubinisphaera margarita]MCG6158353.1 orotidine-5'-phosphate decarboxylase [Rubinisphaera margarita]
MSGFAERLHQAISRKGTPALVGLDPRFDQLPEEIVERAREAGGDEFTTTALAFEEFCKRIIDVVAPLVPAVKPQSAFFEQAGPAGVLALQRVNLHARRQGLIVICDAKRGDIGSTAEAYADAYLAGDDASRAPFAADALTVNPYLGHDTLQPFIKACHERGAGIYVLVRTSNPGAASFQDHEQQDQTLYQKVAEIVEQESAAECESGSSSYGCVGAVVGATYPDELKQLRQAMPHVPLLIPGYGAQGGGAGDVASAFDADGLGAIINSSRGINFAYRREPYASQFPTRDWEQAVEQATLDMIQDIAQNTPAGSLRSE